MIEFICTPDQMEFLLKQCLSFSQLDPTKDHYVRIGEFDPEKEKTEKQNNTFHALLECFYLSGCSSFSSKDKMKNYYKKQIGFIDHYTFFDGEKQVKTKNKADIINKRHATTEFKSLSVANFKQLSRLIELIIFDMDQAGVNTHKYIEILRGMGKPV